MVRKQDQIRGCLLGAAAGDAMGYCLEDLSLDQIREQYGPGGMQGYDTVNGYASISSHTQLAMFTANGLLFGATRGALRGVMAPYVKYIEVACLDWAKTQRYRGRRERERTYCWLCCLDELYSRRNPEVTTLYALENAQTGTIDDPVNHARGWGGLTRCLPIGPFLNPAETPRKEISLLGAESAALTHGDPFGFLPAAYLTDMLNRLLYDKPVSFRSVLHQTCDAMDQQFCGRFSQTVPIRAALAQAEALAESLGDPAQCLTQLKPTDALGVLAAACYVCLKFPGNYDRGIVAAVNHGGASSAVGAVAGALLGIQVGMEGIPEFYLEPLELRDIIQELADDLFQGCPLSRNARLFDDQWDEKYIQCTYET